MNERMEVLNAIKQQMPVLECNPGPNCWCSRISFLFEDLQDSGWCYSPKEVLELVGDKLSDKDKKYLKGLLTREFIK